MHMMSVEPTMEGIRAFPKLWRLLGKWFPYHDYTDNCWFGAWGTLLLTYIL